MKKLSFAIAILSVAFIFFTLVVTSVYFLFPPKEKDCVATGLIGNWDDRIISSSTIWVKKQSFIATSTPSLSEIIKSRAKRCFDQGGSYLFTAGHGWGMAYNMNDLEIEEECSGYKTYNLGE